MNSARVVGVHDLYTTNKVWLIEIEVVGEIESFDFDELTQEIEGVPRELWQVAYDEQLIEREEDKARYAFFFHYLNLSTPLMTSFGELHIPDPTTMPKHLSSIEYIAPC